MIKSVQCDVVCAEEAVFSGKVQMVSLTGSEGDLGITPGHAPLLTAIKPGPISMRLESGEEQTLYISGGFIEVQPQHITVLSDTAIRADDLDESQAEAARQEAENQLSEKGADFDYSLASARLAEAVAQLRTVRQIKAKMGK